MRRSNRPRYQLSPQQYQLIQQAIDRIRPDLRHSFTLRVEQALAVSSTGYGVSDALVLTALNKARAEVVPPPYMHGKGQV